MTKRGVIIANGALQHPENARDAVRPDDLLIAADGGASHCRALGLTPAVIIGDLDSLSPQELASFERAGTQIIRHPAHKDYTDLELALLHARSLGLEQVLILGALGMRWDQTLANLLLPLSSELGGMEIRMLERSVDFRSAQLRHHCRLRFFLQTQIPLLWRNRNGRTGIRR